MAKKLKQISLSDDEINIMIQSAYGKNIYKAQKVMKDDVIRSLIKTAFWAGYNKDALEDVINK